MKTVSYGLLIVALALASPGNAIELPNGEPSRKTEPSRSLCQPLAEMKASMAGHNVKWTTLSPDQWQFLRGVFFLNPSTPPGLPFGDSAGLIQKIGDDKSGALIVFVDGDQGCELMPIPTVLLETLLQLGTITHESHTGQGEEF